MPILHAVIQTNGLQADFAAGSFSFHQATDYEGRPSTDVRLGLIRVTLVGEAAGWRSWEEWMLDPYRRQSGRLVFYHDEGQTAKTVVFYDAFCVHYECRFDARGPAGQASFETVLHLSAAAEEVQGQFSEAHSVIPWAADQNTRRRALSKPTDWVPSAALAAQRAVPRLPEAALPPALALLAAQVAGGAAPAALPGPPASLVAAAAPDSTPALFADPLLKSIREGILSGAVARHSPDLLSVDEQAIIRHYTTEEGYRDFNLALRGQLPMTPFFVAQEKLLNQALAQLPKHQGNVMRGTGSGENDLFKNAAIGDVITYDNFISTSVSEDVADDFMGKKGGECVLIIQSKSGVRVTEMSAMPWEDEILFPSKQSFKVTAKSFRPRFDEDDPLVREVYLEQL